MPCVRATSLKYSIGSTRTSAPVGQFSSHEYARLRAPGGFKPVCSQRLHLIATSSSDAGAGARSGSFKLNSRLNFSNRPEFIGGGFTRGPMEIASYGHYVAQSKQPKHVPGSISTWPIESRKMAPVGQPVRHSGSLQCMHT